MEAKRKKSATRPKSAVTSRQLWVLAMKEGKTGSNLKRKPGTGLPAKQGANGYWTNSLRRSGEGDTNGQPLDTFTNLKLTSDKDPAFLSTTHYLRQAVGVEKPTPRVDSATGRSAVGRPAYKSAEEYYDDVIELKRELKAAREDLNSQKSKNRRLEEESVKRDKQLEALFDPTKNAELRRALSDKNGDSALVVQSLKQRIFKMEQQLREKEATISKLQSDIKITKPMEMKTQLEVLYKEIVRLRSISPAERLYANDSADAEAEAVGPRRAAAAQKSDALAANLRKVMEQKKLLAAENEDVKRQLRDLQQRLEELDGDADIPRDYADMTRTQLLGKLRAMEKENNRLMQAPSDDRLGGKIALSGSMMEKVNLLDRRETELLSELSVLSDANKKLIEERDSYKQQLQENKREVDRLNFENSGIAKQLEAARQQNGRHGNFSSSGARDDFRSPNSSFNSSGRRQSAAAPNASTSGSRLRQDQAVQKLQAVLRGHQTRRQFLETDEQDGSGYDDDGSEYSLGRRQQRQQRGGGGGQQQQQQRMERPASASAHAITGKHSGRRQSRPVNMRQHQAAYGTGSAAASEDTRDYSDDDDIAYG